MYEVKTDLLTEQYSLLKDYSTESEKDKLIISILNENDEYISKEEQVVEVFGEWSTIQKAKINLGLDSVEPISLINLLLAISIKLLNPEELTVRIRCLDNNTLEYWAICKTMDYSILDKVYDVYEQYAERLSNKVEFVFTSEEQFIVRDSIEFLKTI